MHFYIALNIRPDTHWSELWRVLQSESSTGFNMQVLILYNSCSHICIHKHVSTTQKLNRYLLPAM